MMSITRPYMSPVFILIAVTDVVVAVATFLLLRNERTSYKK
jgi:hypothetical protein